MDKPSNQQDWFYIGNSVKHLSLPAACADHVLVSRHQRNKVHEAAVTAR